MSVIVDSEDLNLSMTQSVETIPQDDFTISQRPKGTGRPSSPSQYAGADNLALMG